MIHIKNDGDNLFTWYGVSNGCFNFEITNYTNCKIILHTDEKYKYFITNAVKEFCLPPFDILTAHAICDTKEDVIFWSNNKITNEYLYDPYQLINSSLFACPSSPKLCLYDISLGNNSILIDKCGTKIFYIQQHHH